MANANNNPNAQQIHNFNKANAGGGNPNPAPAPAAGGGGGGGANPNPNPPVGAGAAPGAANLNPKPPLNSKLSTDDIILLQKDVNLLTPDEVIRRKALETKENLRIAEEAKRKQEQDAEDLALKEGRFVDVAKSELQRSLRTGGKLTAPAVNWFERVPTPGGIATLLIIIAIFLMAIIPVDSSGHTRLMLIWLSLTGKTHIAIPDVNFGSTQTSTNTPTSGGTPPVVDFTTQPPVNGTQPVNTLTTFQQPIPQFNVSDALKPLPLPVSEGAALLNLLGLQ